MSIPESQFETDTDAFAIPAPRIYDFDVLLKTEVKDGSKTVAIRPILAYFMETCTKAMHGNDKVEFLTIQGHPIIDVNTIPDGELAKGFLTEMAELKSGTIIIRTALKLKTTVPFSTIQNRISITIQRRNMIATINRLGTEWGLGYKKVGIVVKEHPIFANLNNLDTEIKELIKKEFQKPANKDKKDLLREEIQKKLFPDATSFHFEDLPFRHQVSLESAGQGRNKIEEKPIALFLPRKHLGILMSIIDLMLSAKALPGFVSFTFRDSYPEGYRSIFNMHAHWMGEHRNIQIRHLPQDKVNDPGKHGGMSLYAFLALQGTDILKVYKCRKQGDKIHVSVKKHNFGRIHSMIEEFLRSSSFDFAPTVKERSQGPGAHRHRDDHSEAMSDLLSQANAFNTDASTVTSVTSRWQRGLLGYEPCEADKDLWMKPKTRKSDGFQYYLYILLYVDDCLCIDEDPRSQIEQIDKFFKMKKGSIAEPDIYLGAKLRKMRLPNGVISWSASPAKYVQEVVRNCEKFLRDKYGDDWKLPKRASAPFPNDYHPELDTSPELDAEMAKYFQGQIGVLRWCVELGRVDIATEVSELSSDVANPREGHLEALFHVIGHLRIQHNSRMAYDPSYPEVNMSDFKQCDWKEFYGEVKEPIPPKAPQPRGREVMLRLFVDADHAGDQRTRRSRTGFIVYLNMAPIVWFTKRQPTIETSVFGAEFVAMKNGMESIRALRYKLRMMGVPIDGPALVYGDNMSVIHNTQRPESVLKKKSHSICYHAVRESVAMGEVLTGHISTHDNPADLLTKVMSGGAKRSHLVSLILYDTRHEDIT